MVTILCGLPASGKSTWRHAYAADAVVICLDDIREELTGDSACQRFNDSVMMVALGRYRDALEAEREAVVDATNLTREYRAKWIDLAEEHDQPCECIYFPVSIEAAVERNAGRERQVPEEAIRRMAARLEKPEISEGFERVLIAGQEDMQRLVV